MIDRRAFILAGLLTGTSLVGCSPGTAPTLGDVAGRVTLDGKPVQNARVLFWRGDGRPSEGQTDSSGRYVLRYTVNQNGALIGEHKVRITTRTALADDTMTLETVPAKYNKNSTLLRNVANGSNVIDFDLAK